ncbi:MAG: ribosome silencing factor [bacterium]|nr:ribosome silencing factor [bacterium]
MTSLQFSRKIAALLDEKQATDISIIDLRKVPQAAEFFVIATGMVDQHVRTLADYVEDELRSGKLNRKPRSREGKGNLSWVIVDYGDVVVHIFRPETRKYYQLDKLWGDVPRISVTPASRKKVSTEDDE